MAYTGYLLTARPGRVAVLGLYIGPDYFATVLVEPTRVCRTNYITWGEPPAIRLR